MILPIIHCIINWPLLFIPILVPQIPSLVMFWKCILSLYRKSFLKHFPKINAQNHVTSTFSLKVNWVVRLNDLGINRTKLKIVLWEGGRGRWRGRGRQRQNRMKLIKYYFLKKVFPSAASSSADSFIKLRFREFKGITKMEAAKKTGTNICWQI